MKWKLEGNPDGSRTWRSDCGYAVLQCSTDGELIERFVAFFVDANQKRVVLGGYGSRADAESSAAAHWAKRHEVAA